MKSIFKLFGIIAFLAVSGGNAQGEALTIPRLINEEYNVTNKATIQKFDGSFTATGQQAEHKFTAPLSGRYHFEISNLERAYIRMVIKNSIGSVIGDSVYGISNGEGITRDDIRGGETYTVQIVQSSGLGLYMLSIGYQKPTVNITGFTDINDSIEFKNQINNYTWTAPEAGGRYRFEISNLVGTYIRMVIKNSFGVVIYDSVYGIGNGEGITKGDIRGGETYTIQIGQSSGYSLYRLSINR